MSFYECVNSDILLLCKVTCNCSHAVKQILMLYSSLSVIKEEIISVLKGHQIYGLDNIGKFLANLEIC